MQRGVLNFNAANEPVERKRQMKNKFDKEKTQWTMEKELTKITPLKGQKERAISQWFDRRITTAIDHRNAEAKQAYEFWRAFREQEKIDDSIDAEFKKDFIGWLQGKGKQEDHVRTPWGTQPAMMQLDSVRVWMQTFLDEKYAVITALIELQTRTPFTLNEAYLYFKYLVRDGMARDDALILQDFDRFLGKTATPTSLLKQNERKDEQQLNSHPDIPWVDFDPKGTDTETRKTLKKRASDQQQWYWQKRVMAGSKKDIDIDPIKYGSAKRNAQALVRSGDVDNAELIVLAIDELRGDLAEEREAAEERRKKKEKTAKEKEEQAEIEKTEAEQTKEEEKKAKEARRQQLARAKQLRWATKKEHAEAQTQLINSALVRLPRTIADQIGPVLSNVLQAMPQQRQQVITETVRSNPEMTDVLVQALSGKADNSLIVEMANAMSTAVKQTHKETMGTIERVTDVMSALEKRQQAMEEVLARTGQFEQLEQLLSISAKASKETQERMLATLENQNEAQIQAQMNMEETYMDLQKRSFDLFFAKMEGLIEKMPKHVAEAAKEFMQKTQEGQLTMGATALRMTSIERNLVDMAKPEEQQQKILELANSVNQISGQLTQHYLEQKERQEQEAKKNEKFREKWAEEQRRQTEARAESERRYTEQLGKVKTQISKIKSAAPIIYNPPVAAPGVKADEGYWQGRALELEKYQTEKQHQLQQKDEKIRDLEKQVKKSTKQRQQVQASQTSAPVINVIPNPSGAQEIDRGSVQTIAQTLERLFERFAPQAPAASSPPVQVWVQGGAGGSAHGAPVTQTGAPVTQTGAPVTQTGAPVTQTGAPVTQTGAPVTQTGAPVTQTNAPRVLQEVRQLAEQERPVTLEQMETLLNNFIAQIPSVSRGGGGAPGSGSGAGGAGGGGGGGGGGGQEKAVVNPAADETKKILEEIMTQLQVFKKERAYHDQLVKEKNEKAQLLHTTHVQAKEILLLKENTGEIGQIKKELAENQTAVKTALDRIEKKLEEGWEVNEIISLQQDVDQLVDLTEKLATQKAATTASLTEAQQKSTQAAASSSTDAKKKWDERGEALDTALATIEQQRQQLEMLMGAFDNLMALRPPQPQQQMSSRKPIKPGQSRESQQYWKTKLRRDLVSPNRPPPGSQGRSQSSASQKEAPAQAQSAAFFPSSQLQSTQPVPSAAPAKQPAASEEELPPTQQANPLTREQKRAIREARKQKVAEIEAEKQVPGQPGASEEQPGASEEKEQPKHPSAKSGPDKTQKLSSEFEAERKLAKKVKRQLQQEAERAKQEAEAEAAATPVVTEFIQSNEFPSSQFQSAKHPPAPGQPVGSFSIEPHPSNVTRLPGQPTSNEEGAGLEPGGTKRQLAGGIRTYRGPQGKRPKQLSEQVSESTEGSDVESRPTGQQSQLQIVHPPASGTVEPRFIPGTAEYEAENEIIRRAAAAQLPQSRGSTSTKGTGVDDTPRAANKLKHKANLMKAEGETFTDTTSYTLTDTARENKTTSEIQFTAMASEFGVNPQKATQKLAQLQKDPENLNAYVKGPGSLRADSTTLESWAAEADAQTNNDLDANIYEQTRVKAELTNWLGAETKNILDVGSDFEVTLGALGDERDPISDAVIGEFLMDPNADAKTKNSINFWRISRNEGNKLLHQKIAADANHMYNPQRQWGKALQHLNMWDPIADPFNAPISSNNYNWAKDQVEILTNALADLARIAPDGDNYESVGGVEFVQNVITPVMDTIFQLFLDNSLGDDEFAEQRYNEQFNAITKQQQRQKMSLSKYVENTTKLLSDAFEYFENSNTLHKARQYQENVSQESFEQLEGLEEETLMSESVSPAVQISPSKFLSDEKTPVELLSRDMQKATISILEQRPDLLKRMMDEYTPQEIDEKIQKSGKSAKNKQILKDVIEEIRTSNKPTVKPSTAFRDHRTRMTAQEFLAWLRESPTWEEIRQTQKKILGREAQTAEVRTGGFGGKPHGSE